MARAGEDGLIDTVDGLPDYGPIQVSFTTTGTTGGNLLPDGLDLGRFPVADEFGFAYYNRTFTIPDHIAERLGDMHIVIHGHDLNRNGTYDGPVSSLSDLVGAPVPLEAELPVALRAPQRLRPQCSLTTARDDTSDSSTTDRRWCHQRRGLMRGIK